MAVKLPDTLVPMADFPSAFAKDVQFIDGENLQDKLDNGKLGSSSSGTGLTEEQANNIEKIPSIEGIVTSNSQAITNKADKDHEHTEYLKEIPDEYVTDTELSTELDKKVNKEVDKGLSTNDLTDELVIKINSSATEAFVTNAIANAQLDGGDVDLSGYATVDALNLKADLTHTHDQYLTEVPDEYITETELTDKNYADKEYVTQAVSNVNVDLTEYAKTSDIPTKVSQLTNDSNFITTIPEEYITETELANELSTRNVKTYTNITQLGLTAPVITGRIYNALPENSIFQCEIVDDKTVSDIPENTGILTIQKSSKRLAIEFKACARYSVYPNNLYLGQLKGDDGSGITWNKVALSSDLEGCVTDTELSSKGYATETFVTNKIAEASLSGSGVDLSGYATKDDVPTKTSELTNDSGFINTIPSEYITETELNAKGYLTSHQDISDLQPKTDNNLATTSKEVVGAINEVKDKADLILDTEVRIDKTYSSSKIYTDIQQCLEDSKTYTLEELGKKIGASYEVVTSTDDMVSQDYLYLLNNDNGYDIYIVDVDNVPVAIGDTSIDLSGYVTKTEIESDYLKKTDAYGKYATITTLTTHTDNTDIHVSTTQTDKWDKVTDKLNVADFNTHKNNTDIHITNAERTKWDKVDKKIDKTSITTTIDSTSTNTQVPSAKAVFDSIKDKNSIIDKKGECTTLRNANLDTIIKGGLYYVHSSCNNLPYDCTGGYLCVLYNNELPTTYLAQIMLNWNGKKMYIRTMNGGSWYEWNIINTTTVNDVPKTTITPVFPGEVNVASGGVAINYIVRNGWCNVNFAFNLASATTFSWTNIATGLPKPANNANILLTDESGKINRTIAIKINSTGSVSSRIPVAFTAVDWWTGNISYPVAEY